MTTTANDELQTQIERLRTLYAHLGEDPAVGESAINGMLADGPEVGIARLHATIDAVKQLHGIEEG